MARKNRDGKYILSAGEIGSFTVCAEAWRLKALASANRSKTANSEVGEELHKSWAENNDEVLFLTKGVKLVIFLILLTLVITQLV